MTIDINELKDIRRKLELTQSELAKRSGVSQSLIAKIESGRLDPTLSNWQKIIAAIADLSKHHEKTAEDIMQRKVITIEGNESIKKAVEVMRKHEISQMPVIEGNTIIGLISETTILESIMSSQTATRARDVVEEAPPIIAKNTSVTVVSSLLKYFSMVLVSDRGKYVGLVTKADLISKLYGK